MASGFTFGNRIRKRMGLPPWVSLSFLFYPSFTAFRTVTLSEDQRYILRTLVEQEDDRRGAALFALGYCYWAGCRLMARFGESARLYRWKGPALSLTKSIVIYTTSRSFLSSP